MLQTLSPECDRSISGKRESGRERRRHQRPAGIRVQGLVDVPAEVRAAPAIGRRGEVDLLVEVLPDVGDDQVARDPIEREPPRISQPVRVHLTRRGREGIALRDGVGRAGARIDPQDLPQQRMVVDAVDDRRVARGQVLPVARGIATGPAGIAHADVERAVGPELQLAAVVVRIAVVRDREHDPSGAGVRRVRIGRAAPVLRDRHGALGVLRRVLHVEAAAGLRSRGRTPSKPVHARRRSRTRRSSGPGTFASRRSRPPGWRPVARRRTADWCRCAGR